MNSLAEGGAADAIVAVALGEAVAIEGFQKGNHLAAAEAGLSVSEYKPMQVKQAIHGYGLATKAQVGEMVRILLELPQPLHPDDAADAAAIAICHLHTSHFS